MTEIVPDKEPELWLVNKRAISNGKIICPLSLALRPEVAEIIEWEVDLQTWHVSPFDGPSSQWPPVKARLLRHARGVSNLIQIRQNKEISKKGGTSGNG